ncbi:hypothetical protein O6H91_01G032000 [Diphasiastrum complanatum]|uniref:Uncharacterized protein n=1 Tax=Diphasiastrum complanatum TaxID=34168 RepID=A0ACC2EPN1_DIPCM|nr:hypothetical protein O6H91_01G032000 [Diphasiastrum complanatum]
MAAPLPLLSADNLRASKKAWGVSVFTRASTLQMREEDDEEALQWAALEKLPTYDRLRTALLKDAVKGGKGQVEVDITKLGYSERQKIVGNIFKVAEEDNERFWRRFQIGLKIYMLVRYGNWSVARWNCRLRVGIDLPRIEVRFEHLNVDADVYVGSRALPTLINFTVNVIETFLNKLYILPSKKQNLNILHDISGIVKPSRMTLLLGPPNAGKTTLLLALSGKLDPDLKVSGKVTYNGHDLTEFVPQRTSSYVSQNDLHIGEMTVRETLDFAGRCEGVGHRYDVLSELSRREKAAGIKPEAELDAFMKATAVVGQESNRLRILGLDVCADTLVGDAMHRGISGGQKKRVTTGELLVGPAKALFMDEISTGLDSSTTYQIVKCLRQTVHLRDGTLVVSLLQPAPETYDLFDDLILLSEGHVVYQGPRELVLDFFEGMGFKCPKRKGVADFLQELTSRKDQAQYWADKSQPYTFVPVRKFVEGFAKFHVGQRIAQELATPFDRSTNHPAALVRQKFAISNWELLRACFAREWLLMKRNSFIFVFKTIQVCSESPNTKIGDVKRQCQKSFWFDLIACLLQISIMAAICMTVFFRTKIHQRTVNDGTKYMGAMFFGLINVMFNGFAEVSMTIHRLPIFYKQRDLLFYPPWAFALPTWIMRIPLSLLESGIWVFLTYYVIGFAPEAGRCFRQFLILFCVHQMALGLFRFIASIGRNMIVSYTIGAFALLICFVLGGYVVDRVDIHPWWKWGYWSSPMMYGQNVLSDNEFLADRWRKPFHGDPSISLGKAVLKSRGIFVHKYWVWLGIGALVGYIFLFNFLFTVALTYLNPLGKPQAIISEEELLEKQANQSGQSLSSQSATELRGFNIRASEELVDNKEAEKAASKKGMILPFRPLAIAFNHIDYYVDLPGEMRKQGVTGDKLQLLRNVSGCFRPGILTALVGVSGAGKSGYIEGNITISGYPKNQETFARISGYCEQTDIHSPNVTVYESLVYSAWLRLPSEVDKETRMTFVDQVMELVELTSLRDGMVGLPGVTGLSTEQRKRLTIAVELVANPSIIFMDEPTSGLDARAAAIVMRTVRNTVDTGRTVVCTIHQPSIDIFEAFDELLLMKRGGRVTYAGPLGPRSHKLVEYFQAVDGVPNIKEDYNPATWMLEVSSPAAEGQLGVDFAEIYANSALYERNQALIKELSTPPPGSEDLYFPTKFSQPFWEQTSACLWKQHCSYWRNPHYCVVRMFFTFVCSLIFGTIFWDKGSKKNTAQDVLNVMGAMFSSVLFIGINNAATVQPIVEIERTVCYRERAAGMYSAIPYALAQVTIEIPYIFAQAVIYGLIVYSMVNFDWTAAKFFWFFFFMYTTFLYFTYYGMMAVAFTPNEEYSAVISAAFYASWNLFSGFLIPRPEIPIWWRWNYWATPVAWTLYGLIASQLGDFETPLTTPDGTETTVKEFLKSYFGFHHDFLGAVAGVHIGMVIGFAVVFALCIKHFNFQKR